MKALGMIETIGLVGAIEAVDTALKTADVDIVNKHIVKGGIVTVELTGDVGAIKVAGAEAAKKLGVFVSSHVIARPDDMVSKMIEENSVIYCENESKEIEVTEEKTLEIKNIKEENIPEQIKEENGSVTTEEKKNEIIPEVVEKE